MVSDPAAPEERPAETGTGSAVRSAARWVVRWLVCAVVAGAVSTPWAVERAVEQASFDDRLGTLPVRVGLSHDGYTTLDTGVFGKVYWRRTGPLGFGARLRSTGPPLAGGTLASYATPAFVRANTSFVDDPDGLAEVYGAELRRQVVDRTVRAVVIDGILAGTFLAVGWHLSRGRRRRTRAVVSGVVLVVGVVGGVTIAALEFASWDGNEPIEELYPLADHPDFAFSSPQSREIALQVQPFIEKNTERIRARTARYEAAAIASLDEQLAAHATTLAPRDGEVVVIAEADPQGSIVGTRVRRALYGSLRERLPDDGVALRAIAGDITSNGTVAEAAFVADEVAASPDVPVVTAKGDHDTDVTVEQLVAAGALVPDTEVVDVGGLRVASARDPAFKALFGGLVVNESGITEEQTGAALRDAVDEERGAAYVVVHQPRTVDGYLGSDLDGLRTAGTSLTVPVDDGLPDIPAGVVTYGHLHDPAGPWVVWNTGGSEVTWTVVTQLGTAGGVEETPTFNRFSTPFSAPLKALSIQLQYLNPETGLQTGFVSISVATDGTATIEDRVDVGLPGGRPGAP